jgi:hypothetical protein
MQEAAVSTSQLCDTAIGAVREPRPDDLVIDMTLILATAFDVLLRVNTPSCSLILII